MIVARNKYQHVHTKSETLAHTRKKNEVLFVNLKPFSQFAYLRKIVSNIQLSTFYAPAIYNREGGI